MLSRIKKINNQESKIEEKRKKFDTPAADRGRKKNIERELQNENENGE